MKNTKYDQFRKLDRSGDPLILFNIWDAGSAAVVAQARAIAIATGSRSMAAASGFDGKRMPLELVIRNIQRIVEAVQLPDSLES